MSDLGIDALVNGLTDRYDDIPEEGDNSQAILDAYDRFKADVAEIRKRLSADQGKYDAMGHGPWMALSVMMDCLQWRTENALDGGGEREWEELKYAIIAFQFLLTHPRIAEYEPHEIR